MAKKFYIDFKLTVSTARVIQADSEKDAVAIAEDMIRDGDYWEGIIQSIDDDCMNWCSSDCMVHSFGVADDTHEADNE